MAELDDFFAKKDRKKGKTVKKFSTPEEVVKKIEDTKQKIELKVRKERQAGQGTEGEDGVPMPGDEDEWREYEVAKKDYTGLKIQHLSINEENQAGNCSGGNQGMDGNSSGQMYGGDGQGNNPWNKTDSASESAPALAPTPVENPAPPAPRAETTYKPPALRKSQQSNSDVPPARRGQKTHAPDIHNEDYFPTLGKEKKPSSLGGAWTEAGGSSRVRAPPSGLHPPKEVPLGNRFTSLTNDS